MAQAQAQLTLGSAALLAVVGAVAFGVYQTKKRKEDEERFLALAEEVEIADFNLLTLLAKGGGLLGDLQVLGIKGLSTSGVLSDALGEEHSYTGGKAWLVDAEISGNPVTLLVRRNGTVQLLEG